MRAGPLFRFFGVYRELLLIVVLVRKNEEDPLSAIMKKIHSKLKALEWSQHFYHYKFMGIFPNAQGHVTHKSLAGSCRLSNPYEILCVSLLTARMKKIRLKMKALEWSQHYSLIFQTLKGR